MPQLCLCLSMAPSDPGTPGDGGSRLSPAQAVSKPLTLEILLFRFCLAVNNLLEVENRALNAIRITQRELEINRHWNQVHTLSRILIVHTWKKLNVIRVLVVTAWEIK